MEIKKIIVFVLIALCSVEWRLIIRNNTEIWANQAIFVRPLLGPNKTESILTNVACSYKIFIHFVMEYFFFDAVWTKRNSSNVLHECICFILQPNRQHQRKPKSAKLQVSLDS